MLRTALTALISLMICVPRVHAQAGPEGRADFAVRAIHAQDADQPLASIATTLETRLTAHPDDDHSRFALGIVRFLISGERIFQTLYTHGAGDQRRNPFLSMGLMMRPVPLGVNPNPEPISHQKLRMAIATWLDDLAAAERTLAEISDPDLKLRVRVGMLRMDLQGDGKSGELWRAFVALRTRFRPNAEAAAAFDIAFDRGDVDWLRGYCHLAMAAGEAILAHDTRDIFDRTAHLFFASPETPYPFLLSINADDDDAEMLTISDLIAFFHLLSFDVIEPERMRLAHGHLKSAVARSRAMWAFYDTETDNDHEWIPNPKQDGVIGQARVSEEARAVWLDALDEADALLDARRLARFWRGDGSKGINVRRVFLEPQPFDLVLWIQGSAAGPYLEEGPLTSDGLWTRMEQAFDRRVFTNMFWMN